MNHPIRHAVSVLALTLCWGGCHEDAPTPRPAKHLPKVAVRVQTIKSQRHQGGEEVMGTVRAMTRATIAAKVSGRVASMPVQLGQAVRPGQLLARLDAQEISARLSQARARAEQAQADLKRFSALLAQQAVTQQEYDAAQTGERVARAAVQEARTQLGYATVRAPFAGVVTRKLVDVGDLATPGRPLLELEDPKRLRLEVGVAEALIDRVTVGTKLPLRLDQGAEVEGEVAEVSPSADPNSRTFLVKIDLPQQQGLRAGQFGRARIPTARTDILRVPQAAVVLRGQMELIFVVADARAHLRLIKTGKRFGSEIEVVSGLGDGETVVVEGAGRLVDGQQIEVKR